MPQKPELRQAFDEWAEKWAKKMEEDGAHVRTKYIDHNRGGAEVELTVTVGRAAIDD